jgi:predicted esterase
MGNPRTYASDTLDLPILLVHGTEDLVVPISFSEDLADDLEGAGADVQLLELSGIDHAGVRDPAIVGGLIEAFVEQHHDSTPG